MKLLFVAAATAAALVLAGTALADQTFNDSTDETTGSADISTVAVSNDPTAGTVTFAVQTNMTTLETNSEIDILVDADQNASTGSTNGGFEYLFGLDPGGWYFTSWNGSQFADVASVTDLAVQFSNGLATFTVPVADLNNPQGFNFGAITFRGPDPNNPIVDQAPDNGVWSYTLTTPPPPPTTTTAPPPPAPVTVSSVAVASAGVPTHGKVFHISGLTVDLSNGVETKAKSLKCSATLGGKHLAGTGTGGCTFHLPATAKGKKLVVKVTGAYKSTKLAKTKTFKVK